MAHRQIAWCYSLSKSLRNHDAKKHLLHFITKKELRSLHGHSNIPLALLDHQSQDLCQLHAQKLINDYQQVQIDGTLLRLCASMGQAERIKNTFFPKTYRLTLHLFIYIFLVTLSLSLTNLQGPTEVLLMVFISLPFFLLEKIATSIQDPFENTPTDTSMTSISRTIEINIKQLLEIENDVPEPIDSDTFYVL